MSEEPAKSMTPRERLPELYRRLGATPKAESSDVALRELCEVLDQVENEFSGVTQPVRIPAPAINDGRMYRPLEDHIVRRPDGSILALTRGHRIEVASDGSLRIVNKSTAKVEFEK